MVAHGGSLHGEALGPPTHADHHGQGGNGSSWHCPAQARGRCSDRMGTICPLQERTGSWLWDGRPPRDPENHRGRLQRGSFWLSQAPAPLATERVLARGAQVPSCLSLLPLPSLWHKSRWVGDSPNVLGGPRGWDSAGLTSRQDSTAGPGRGLSGDHPVEEQGDWGLWEPMEGSELGGVSTAKLPWEDD